MRAARTVWLVVVCLAGCAAPQITRAPAPTGAAVEFWREPAGREQLFYGSGGREVAPDPEMTYALLKRDPSGFSTTLDVRDTKGRKWSAKMGPEASTEVVASRIVWAMGYPQPPSYYVPRLSVNEKNGVRDEGPARLRPDLEWLDNRGIWSWSKNPFVGTQPYRGLLVLMMVLNSTDLKDDNNTLYFARRPPTRPVFWYAVKDLGASLGDTGRFSPKRGDINEFERHGFIKGMSGPYVKFEFKGRHTHLLERLHPTDVRWTCERLSRLSDAQWREAFRAGGYTPEVTARYVRKIKDKIHEGLALGPAKRAS
jgi:hypothetical protein